MYKFGAKSTERMYGVNKYLTETAEEALDFARNDMTVPWMGGVRTAEEQKDIYNRGYTKADGYKKVSYHQSGFALDIVPYINGAQDYEAEREFLSFANIMLTLFNYRKIIGEIPKNIYLHWGGFWGAKDNNGDGLLASIEDKTGWDKAHYELRNYPQKRVLTIKT